MGFRLGPRHLAEVLLWFVTLICFGHVTFRGGRLRIRSFIRWSWRSFRSCRGPRFVSDCAGRLLASLRSRCCWWELIPVLSGGRYQISQSPANIWIFVGIVSITSVCLAAIMTELRDRERKIAENESRLRAFTDALPDVAFVLSKDGVIGDVFAASDRTRVNHAIFDVAATCGKRIDELFGEHVSQGFYVTIERALTLKQVSTYEYVLRSVDGREHWFEARVTPMRGAEGELQQVVWVAYDISARLADEKAIRDRDQILKSTAIASNALLTNGALEDAVDSALFEMSHSLHVDRAFIFAVEGADCDEDFQNFGIRYEWLRNDRLPSLHQNPSFQSAPFEQFCPGWYDALVEDGVVKVEYDTKSAAEREIPELFHSRALLAIPMWHDRKLYGFLGVDHCEAAHQWDETEINAVRLIASSLSGLILIRENEANLHGAKESADAASVAKGEFLAMMSHEIRTPMNAIIGYTVMLSQSELSPTQADQASIIKRSGRALLDLINNILDYSKIESRSLELERVRFDLEQIVCEALEGILPQAKDKQLRVDYEIDLAVQGNFTSATRIVSGKCYSIFPTTRSSSPEGSM